MKFKRKKIVTFTYIFLPFKNAIRKLNRCFIDLNFYMLLFTLKPSYFIILIILYNLFSKQWRKKSFSRVFVIKNSTNVSIKRSLSLKQQASYFSFFLIF